MTSCKKKIELPDEVKEKLEQLLAQTGGRKKQKKHSKKPSKKVSKKPSKKPSKKQSKKSSKKPSKKNSKKQKGGRELPPAIRARIDLAKFITNELKVKGGIIIQKLIKVYADKVKEKNPSIDAVTLVEEAKKQFIADKKGALEILKKLGAKDVARATSKKGSKKGSKKSSKKRQKKHSKKN